MPAGRSRGAATLPGPVVSPWAGAREDGDKGVQNPTPRPAQGLSPLGTVEVAWGIMLQAGLINLGT